MTSLRGTDMIRKTLAAAGALGTSLFVSAAAFAQETAEAVATAAPAAVPGPEAAAAVATTLIKAPTVEQMATMVNKGTPPGC